MKVLFGRYKACKDFALKQGKVLTPWWVDTGVLEADPDIRNDLFKASLASLDKIFLVWVNDPSLLDGLDSGLIHKVS